MRKYSRIDMLRFLNFHKENPNIKGVDLLKKYDQEFPELTPKQKLLNLSKALDLKDLTKAIKDNEPNDYDRTT